MNVNDFNTDAITKAILKVLTRDNDKCTCSDNCTCKKEENSCSCKENDFKGQNIKINTECQSTTYDPAFDEMWDTVKSPENRMRWITRLFKAWYRKDVEKVDTLLNDITEDEVAAITSFYNTVTNYMQEREGKLRMSDSVSWKVKAILTDRKAKYDWVTYTNLNNLVCTNIDIDAHDPRVDNAVAQDFFISATTKLHNGEEIEIDVNDFKSLTQYLQEAFESFAISYDNGKVTAKF